MRMHGTRIVGSRPGGGGGIELLSFHQYGSIGLCVRHVNMLAALFGLKTPIEPREQVRLLARLWAERKRGVDRLRSMPETDTWWDLGAPPTGWADSTGRH